MLEHAGISIPDLSSSSVARATEEEKQMVKFNYWYYQYGEKIYIRRFHHILGHLPHDPQLPEGQVVVAPMDTPYW